MANGAPLKYIDIQSMLQNMQNKSLAATLLPGQGQITPASPEFLAGKQNPFPNALPLPSIYNVDSLAGTLGQMGQGVTSGIGTPIADRQAQGFFADTMARRMAGVN